MSAVPGREDLGALGCTRDGYRLIGAATLVGLALWPLFALTGWHAFVAGWGFFAAGALHLIGVAATSRAPHGPFGRWTKRIVVVAYAWILLPGWFHDLQPFEHHHSPYLQALGEGYAWVWGAAYRWSFTVGVALLAGLSARFAWRRGVPVAALAWMLLALWSVAMHLMPFSGHLAISSWWEYAHFAVHLGGCLAALQIRAAAGVV